jgi:hypothetical protein
MLEGYIYNGSNQSYRFAVNEVTDVARTVTTDSVIAGRIEVPGQRHKLTFTLDRAQTVWFDSLLPSDVTMRIDGPRGEEQSTRSLQSSDWQYANPVMALVAGSYTVTLEGPSGQVGDYAIQLLTRASAQELERGVAVSDVLSDQDAFKPQYRVASEAALTTPGSAQVFNNAAPRITLADQAALNPDTLTFETWVKADNPSFFQTIAAKNHFGDFSGGYGLFTEGGQVKFYVNTIFDDSSRVSAALTAGVWTHVAGSFDGQKLRLFINGVLAEEKDYATPITHSSDPLMVGDLSGFGYYPFYGQLDETRLWNRALSAEDVAWRAVRWGQRMGWSLLGAMTARTRPWCWIRRATGTMGSCRRDRGQRPGFIASAAWRENPWFLHRGRMPTPISASLGHLAFSCAAPNIRVFWTRLYCPKPANT